MTDERSRALSALEAIDPGCAREQWHRIGRAAIAAGLSVDDLDRWSQSAPNYAGSKDVQASFRTIRPDGGTGPGTLFKAALEAGWQDPDKTRQSGHGSRPNGQDRGFHVQAEKTRQRRKQTASVAEIWAGCVPATTAEPYIFAKRGKPDGLRVYPATAPRLTIAGQNVAGWLVVPACSLSGELRTLQFIPPPGRGKKLNLPGAGFSDGLFLVGRPEQSARLFIVEGIGQAWACQQATGDAAIVTFGAGRMPAVAEILRAEFPDKRLVLVPDRGKEEQAQRVAKDVGGLYVEMPQDKPSNYDANDYAAEHGAEALAELLGSAKPPAMRYRLRTAAELVEAPPLRWLIRGVLPAEGVAAIYGPSASGKSFLALDLGAAVASGAPWFRARVSRAPVVYLALEGEAGIGSRVKAWQLHHGAGLPDALSFITQPFDLRESADVVALVEAVQASGRAGGLLILDTLNRAAPGADENSSQDMGHIIEAAKVLQAALGGLVLLVHHTGKDQSRGLRGHSSLFAALDAAIEVKRDGDRREWRVAKAKDDADGDGCPFRLDVVQIGEYEDGVAITSCAVVPDVSATEVTRRRTPKGGNQRIVWDALSELLERAREYGKAGAPAMTPCMELEAAITAIAPRLTCEPKRRSERARQAITGLVAQGLIACNDGWLWAR